jgi:hypothetical protein
MILAASRDIPFSHPMPRVSITPNLTAI